MDNISSFAENLILNQISNVQEGKELPPSAQPQRGHAPAGKDIRGVDVPDSFMQEILGEQYTPQDSKSVDEIPQLVWTDPNGEEESQAPQALTEETAQQLVPLLEDVKGLLKEMTAAMTSSGSIGVNLAGPQKEKDSWAGMEKRYGYQPTKAPTLPGDSRKSVLKQSIKSKLKRKK
jgi:hypothetical protein